MLWLKLTRLEFRGNCVSDHQEDQEENTDEFPLSTRRDMLTSRRREREQIHFMMLAIINIYHVYIYI